MEIITKTNDGIMIAEISGSIDANTAPKAQAELLPIAAKESGLILDMKKCDYISSAGLRVLLMMAKHLSAKSGKIVLAGLSNEIKEIMEMTGFDHMFRFYDTIAAAKEAIMEEK